MHASKVVLKVLSQKLETMAELFLGEDQYGFRKGRGTRDATAACGCCTEETWNIIMCMLCGL